MLFGSEYSIWYQEGDNTKPFSSNQTVASRMFVKFHGPIVII